MGRHVVGSFGGVNEEAVAIGDDFRHEGFEVVTNIWVGIFLDEERRGGVADLESAEAVCEFCAGEFAFDLVSEFVEAATFGLDLDFGEGLFHLT